MTPPQKQFSLNRGASISSLLCVLLMLPLILSTRLEAGSIISGFKEQLGIQPIQPLPGPVNAGDNIDAIVVNPQKFNRQGFSGAKRNDAVVVTVVEVGRRFSVTHTRSGVTHVFVLNAKGKLVRVG